MCDSHVKLVKLIRDHTIVSSYMYCEFFSCEAMSHWLHWKGFSPVWILRWTVRLIFLVTALSHCLHWWYFHPVWVFWCLLGFRLLQNPSHTGCIEMVSLQYEVEVVLQNLSHLLHWQCFSQVWVVTNIVRLVFLDKAMLHWLY